MPDALRVGVLGTGSIIENAMIIPAKQVPEVTVAAVGSRSVERAEAYALPRPRHTWSWQTIRRNWHQ